MYYRVARLPINDVIYPTLVLDPRPSDEYLRGLQVAANVVREKLSAWPTNQDFNVVPSETFAGPIRTYRSEGSNGTYHAYFQGIRQYYTVAANDKINLALAYLAEFAAPVQQLALPRTGGAQVLANEPPLNTLWTALTDALSDKKLPRLPTARSPQTGS